MPDEKRDATATNHFYCSVIFSRELFPQRFTRTILGIKICIQCQLTILRIYRRRHSRLSTNFDFSIIHFQSSLREAAPTNAPRRVRIFHYRPLEVLFHMCYLEKVGFGVTVANNKVHGTKSITNRIIKRDTIELSMSLAPIAHAGTILMTECLGSYMYRSPNRTGEISMSYSFALSSSLIYALP